MSEEVLITTPMVNKATYLIHKLATRRGADFKDIQKKCKQRLGYTNLAKVTLEEGHTIITKLIEWTGGEEEEQEVEVTDDLSKPKTDELVKEPENKMTEKEDEEDLVITVMRQSVRAAVDITLKEVVEKEIPVMGLGGFVLEIGKVIFDAKMSAEVD